MTDAACGTARLESNYEEYLCLVETARRHLRNGRLEDAAVWTQIAGHYAWMNHTGLFASPALEGVLGELGARLPGPTSRRPSARAEQEVLHVVTQCYQTGGSTQAIACWIEQDHDRHHRVCVTRQRGAPPPDKLVGRLQDPSDLIRLDTRRGGLMSRAARLRALAREADLVLLHLHPYDVVPVIAFAGGDGLPPVIYVDHCDHVFWLGTSIATVVMHMRESGRDLAGARRGIDPARSLVVPRPLRVAGRVVDRCEAKRRLGIDPHQVLIVTAADGSKYRPVGSPGFLDIVVPVLEEHQNALLYAAGPSPDSDWSVAGDKTGGRLRALGSLPDVRLLQEAADVYIDSYPFSSLTSLLEAGSLNVPAVTYRGHPAECGVLGADTRGVDEHMVRAADPAELRWELGRLIADADLRSQLGERTARAIRATHTGQGWLSAVEDLYRAAAATPPAGVDDGPGSARAVTRAQGRLDVLIDVVQAQTGFAQGISDVTRDHLAFLPVGERLAWWSRLTVAGNRPPHRDVVPEWLLARLWRYVQAARGARRAVGVRASGAQRGHA
jgi:hypothetical protein